VIIGLAPGIFMTKLTSDDSSKVKSSPFSHLQNSYLVLIRAYVVLPIATLTGRNVQQTFFDEQKFCLFSIKNEDFSEEKRTGFEFQFSAR
jgi:hypothetical protein